MVSRSTKKCIREKNIGKINCKFILTSIICIVFLLTVGSAYAWEENHDLPGMNYKNFDLSDAEPRLCEEACMKERACKAWTYVKPGIQSRSARCWLKNGMPTTVFSTCCVSGIKQLTTPETSERTLEQQITSPKVVPEYLCPEIKFVSTSPLPSTVVGEDYKYWIQTTGGYDDMGYGDENISFCPMDIIEGSGRCDNNLGMPLGLTLSKTGLISGQVVCKDPNNPASCAGYKRILVKAWDYCPNGAKNITKEFWINIKEAP